MTKSPVYSFIPSFLLGENMKEIVWIFLFLGACCCCHAQDPYLLVVERTAIRRVSLDGATVAPVIEHLTDPGRVVVSSVNGYIFYIDATNIYRANLDGSSAVAIVTGLDSPEGLVLDETPPRIYWSDTGAGVVERADFDGKNREVLADNLDQPAAIFSPPDNFLYVNNGNKTMAVELDGANVTTLGEHLSWVTAAIFDLPSQMAYVHDGEFGTIYANSMSTDGSYYGGALLAPGSLPECEGLAVVSYMNEDYLYYTDSDQTLFRISTLDFKFFYFYANLTSINETDVTTFEIVREGLDQPRAIALVDPALYVDPGAPVLTAPTTPEGALKFICDFTAVVKAEAHNDFRVWFRSADKIVETMVVTGHEAVLTLDNDEALKRDVGNTMECLVQTRMMINGEEKFGEEYISNIFQASVTSQTRSLNLAEGGATKEILLTCNAPPAFFGEPTFSLLIELVKENTELRTAHGQIIDQAVVEAQPNSDSSELVVTGDNWWKSGELKFRVRARMDGKVEYGHAIRQMRVYQAVTNRDPVTIATTTLRITDRSWFSQCSASNDPYIRTVDGNWYSLQWLGEFVFYRNGNYQIDIVLQPCWEYWPTPTCTCGIYIRVDSDVWVFDKCLRAGGNRYANPLMMYVITPPGQPVTSNVQIRSDSQWYGRTLVVILPHGGQLTITYGSSSFLNAYYSPSAADWNQMDDPPLICSHLNELQIVLNEGELILYMKVKFGVTIETWQLLIAKLYNVIDDGLCGTFDGEWNNDFTLRDRTVLTQSWRWSYYPPTKFVQDWRATEDDSLTWGVWEVEATSVLKIVYCSVIEGALEVCTEGLDIVPQGSVADDNDIADEIAKQKFDSQPYNRNKFAAGVENVRKKRAAEPAYGPLDPFAPIVADVAHVPVEPTWPTQDGRTEEEVTTFCESSINDHPGVQICQTMLDDDFSDTVRDCVNDIKGTDNLEWADDAIASILKRCTIHADKVDNSAADGDPPPPLPNGVDRTALFSAVCPNDCSGNGTCTDGACVCTGDYVGADCSMHLTDPPEVTFLFETFCDLSSRSCADAIVFGDKFHNRPTLTCHFQEYTLGEPLPTGPATEVLAHFTKFDQIACPMPEGHRPHILQVSNDGTNMAAARRLFAPHHLDCFSCSMAGDDITTATCIKKPRTCLIDGNCYMHGEEDPDDSCQVCKSDKSYSSWTAGCILGVGMILAYTAAAVFAVILIIVMILIVYFCIREPPNPEAKGIVRRMSTDNRVHPFV